MINLIPPAAKKSIVTEYWIRVFSVWLILWAIAFFTAASVLLPTYVLIDSQAKVHEASAALASQKVADYENVSEALINASQQARLAVDEVDVPRFSKYMLLFESLQGEDIQITEIDMSRSDIELNLTTIKGVAADRQALASFRDKLLANEEVEEVDLPISNLARDKDIQFTIEITLVNKNDV